jgi:hypothetical protein
MEKWTMVASTPERSPKKPASRWKLWLMLKLLCILGILTAIIMLYSWIVLTWSYSEGERAGVLQKFSRKGWVCKTYEGELAVSIVPGVAPTIWNFSVREETIARQIEQALGRRVVIHYKEHKGIPTYCFGETGYFVDSVRIVE